MIKRIYQRKILLSDLAGMPDSSFPKKISNFSY